MDGTSAAPFHLNVSSAVEKDIMRGCAELGTPELPSTPSLLFQIAQLERKQKKLGKENRTENELGIKNVLKDSTKIEVKEIIYAKCHLQP